MHLKSLLCFESYYLYLKLIKLFGIPQWPVIWFCDEKFKKVLTFLDTNFKPVMQNGGSYTNDTDNFLSTIKTLILISNDALFTEDAVGLYLNALKNA